ncbi:MAG: alpha/beta fold hydrolase [Kiritimatiellae bacterium]|nr:alpha/beta fold hydrolase [Kiritimatiellia bacterium]
MVLIHGLGRTSRSMSWLARRLGEAGFRPVLFDYPSQREPLDRLVERLHPFWSNAAGDGPPHAVTHSMGGVLLWMYAARHPEMLIGRVVMLAPPGRGSELADRLAASNLGRRLLGPAGCALGTLPSSPLRALEPVRFELGVIAGRHSLNPLFSAWIPGADDGKVAVARAHVPGMKEFLLVPCSHTWIMFDEEVIRLTVHFLRNGSFRSTPGSARAAAGLAR